VAIPQVNTARDRAILLTTALFERFVPRADWRHTDIEEIVDALIEAGREPVSEHTRAVAGIDWGAEPGVEGTALREERPADRRRHGDRA
jgi:hypothetical protein